MQCKLTCKFQINQMIKTNSKKNKKKYQRTVCASKISNYQIFSLLHKNIFIHKIETQF